MATAPTRKTSALPATAAVGLAMVLSASDAHAFALTGTSNGDPLQIHFTGFTTENAGVPTGNSGGQETTWGAGTVDQIKNLNTNSTAWSQGQAGQSLAFMLYGIADTSATGTSPVTIYNTGCTVGTGCDGKIHLDVYLINGGNPSFAGATGVHTSDRTGFNSLHGITDVGSLFMSWTFTPGVVNGDSSTTLFQNVSSTHLPATGKGEFLANCTGGLGCALFDSNAINDTRAAGGTDPGADPSIFADFFGQFTLNLVGSSLTGPAGNGWQGLISDPVLAQATVSEPGTIAMLGFGLLGIAGVGRRIRRKAA